MREGCTSEANICTSAKSGEGACQDCHLFIMRAASRHLRQLRTQEPYRFSHVYENSHVLEAYLKKTQSAIEYFNEALKHNKENFFAYNGIGSVFKELDNDDEATLNYKKAIKITDVQELGDVMIKQLSQLFDNKTKKTYH